ncbi:MAG TPA: hypothetical protein DCP90_05140 [Clostridiales bacterium]|nr:MAG: hypothetical protein A2Y22_09065 [Clostridiales bacterium GWD2_32_59]HAN09984.1 hypothetical protein [Clostridiales bacterium]
MNIVNNSGLVIIMHNIKIYYQNSMIYIITQRMIDHAINMLKNSYVVGFIFNENKKNEYFENSITYRIIIRAYKIKGDILRCLIRWSNDSVLFILLRAIKKVGTRCFENLLKVYKNSMIYSMYIDWIESEVI